jgi:hypothetical protein
MRYVILTSTNNPVVDNDALLVGHGCNLFYLSFL